MKLAAASSSVGINQRMLPRRRLLWCLSVFAPVLPTLISRRPAQEHGALIQDTGSSSWLGGFRSFIYYIRYCFSLTAETSHRNLQNGAREQDRAARGSQEYRDEWRFLREAGIREDRHRPVCIVFVDQQWRRPTSRRPALLYSRADYDQVADWKSREYLLELQNKSVMADCVLNRLLWRLAPSPQR